MNPNPTTSIPALSDSVRASHRVASLLEEVLDAILGELTGNGRTGGPNAAATPSSGLLYDADNLTNRLGELASRAQDIQVRLSSPAMGEVATGGGGYDTAKRNY